MGRKSLIIVESPGKIKTIQHILGDSYQVKASVGHIMNLPKNRLGVNVENGFEPEYTVIFGKKKVIEELKALSSKSSKVFLAPDPDREGETIAWNLAGALGIPDDQPCRVTFNAITAEDVKKALEQPGKINFGKVKSQQSRRVLDRLVGYQLSPLLWKKIKWGLSAGRVQSAALLVCVEREKEIEAFNIEEYWQIHVHFLLKDDALLDARLITAGETAEKDFVIRNEKEAKKFVDLISKSTLHVMKNEVKKHKRKPPPPFITSTLQQEASKRFGMSPSRTMSVAQKLYEGVNIRGRGHAGLITYMRTDSVRLTPQACKEAQGIARRKWGADSVPARIRTFAKKGKAQDAHEAIRPAYPEILPEEAENHLTREQAKLYELIWRRFVAGQMSEAVYEKFNVDIGDRQGEELLLRATGSRLIFPGYMAVYVDEEAKTADLPPVEVGMELKPQEIIPEQKFTQPPPRYNEASLIRVLEKQGIGRPSTYAVIVSTIAERGYVFKEDKKIRPTDLGIVANAWLRNYFSDVINVDFTARMEDMLDKIEEGSVDAEEMLRDFYLKFQKDLQGAEEYVQGTGLLTDVKCPECDKPMMVKFGRTGRFLSCSGYPKCKGTVNIPGDRNIIPADYEMDSCISICDRLEELNQENSESAEAGLNLAEGKCELCGSDLIHKDGRYGPFISCSSFPKCRYTKKVFKSTGVECPVENCGGQIIEKRSRRGRIFYGCDQYPNCDFTLWKKPNGDKCPECSSLMVEYSGKKGVTVRCSSCKPAASAGKDKKVSGKAASAGKEAGKTTSGKRAKPVG